MAIRASCAFLLCLPACLLGQTEPEFPAGPPVPEFAEELTFGEAREPKLNQPTPEQAKERVLAWLEAAYPGDAKRKAKVEAAWKPDLPVPLLVEQVLALTDDGAAALLEACQGEDLEAAEKAAAAVFTPDAGVFLKANLGQTYARFLTGQKRYDEALEVYAKIAVGDVIDPAGFLFYRGVCEFGLLKKGEALDTLTRLQDDVGSPPERYAALSELMLFDLEYLDEEGLDHLSRTMADVQRRLGLNRVGEKVQEEEKEIIERLDKIIKKLEDQQRGGGGGCGGGSNPQGGQGSPAQDSRVMRGKGAGHVDKAAQKGASAWGNLPEKERQRMLQALGRDFPAHYRSAIEEYFRKLASEERDSEEP